MSSVREGAKEIPSFGNVDVFINRARVIYLLHPTTELVVTTDGASRWSTHTP